MIDAFQHVGIGVSDISRSYDFYRKVLGFSVKLNDHEAELDEMVSIVGSLERMKVIMAMNMAGGGAVELVQQKSSGPRQLPDVRWGDLGFIAAGLKATRLRELMDMLDAKGAEFLTPMITTEVEDGGTWLSAYLRDPDGIIIELLETPESGAKRKKKPRVGGFNHVVIGVSDVKESVDFYSDVIGYDAVVFDRKEPPEGIEPVTGGAEHRSVMLKRSRKPTSRLPLEGGMIQLVKSESFKGQPLFEGRRWGDVGIMEVAVDVSDIEQTYSKLVDDGAEPFCEPTRIDMGWGSAGAFAYVKDPDGNIVELVEVEKLGFLPPTVISPMLSGILRVTSR